MDWSAIMASRDAFGGGVRSDGSVNEAVANVNTQLLFIVLNNNAASQQLSQRSLLRLVEADRHVYCRENGFDPDFFAQLVEGINHFTVKFVLTE